MAMLQSLREKWIRFFVNPFQAPEPVDVKKTLRKASRILVLLPGSGAHPVHSRMLRQVESAFPGSHLTIVHPGGESPSDRPLDSHTVLYLHLKNQSIRQMRKSQVLLSCIKGSYDVLLDLDPEFSLVGFYLARLKSNLFSIGLAKSFSGRYYHILYNGAQDANYEEKLSCLLKVLKGFTAR